MGWHHSVVGQRVAAGPGRWKVDEKSDGPGEGLMRVGNIALVCCPGQRSRDLGQCQSGNGRMTIFVTTRMPPVP